MNPSTERRKKRTLLDPVTFTQHLGIIDAALMQHSCNSDATIQRYSCNLHIAFTCQYKIIQCLGDASHKSMLFNVYEESEKSNRQ